MGYGVATTVITTTKDVLTLWIHQNPWTGEALVLWILASSWDTCNEATADQEVPESLAAYPLEAQSIQG